MSDATDSKPDSALVTEGKLRIRVQRGDAETVHEFDVMEAQLTCEECVRENGLLANDNGGVIATIPFLKDLAARLSALGLEGCTPSMAWQAWLKIGKAMEQLGN